MLIKSWWNCLSCHNFPYSCTECFLPESFACIIQDQTTFSNNTCPSINSTLLQTHMSIVADLLHPEAGVAQRQWLLLTRRTEVYYRHALNQRQIPLPAQCTGKRTALHFPSQQRGTLVQLLLNCLIPISLTLKS